MSIKYRIITHRMESRYIDSRGPIRAGDRARYSASYHNPNPGQEVCAIYLCRKQTDIPTSSNYCLRLSKSRCLSNNSLDCRAV